MQHPKACNLPVSIVLVVQYSVRAAKLKMKLPHTYIHKVNKSGATAHYCCMCSGNFLMHFIMILFIRRTVLFHSCCISDSILCSRPDPTRVSPLMGSEFK